MSIKTYCFSREQLKIIIQDYLSMSPYFQVLDSLLPRKISCDFTKPHPISIGIYCSQISANLLKSQSTCQDAILYPLETIVALVNSQYFYARLPKESIVNGLITTTNLAIILQVLSIVSEELTEKMSRNFSTQHKRSVAENNKNVYENKKSVSHKPPREELKSGVNNLKKCMSIEMTIKEDQFCEFCTLQKKCIFDSQERIQEQALSFIPKEITFQLRLVEKVVSLFTVYLMENNAIYIPNELNLINRIIAPLDRVVTSSIFESDANPYQRQKRAACKAVNKPQNLLQQLFAYCSPDSQNIHEVNNKLCFSIQQLFRMILRSPSSCEVKEAFKEHLVASENSLIDYKGWSEEKDPKTVGREMEQITRNKVNLKPIYQQPGAIGEGSGSEINALQLRHLERQLENQQFARMLHNARDQLFQKAFTTEEKPLKYKEREASEKMHLNGLFLRNQIFKQIQSGEAVLFSDYESMKAGTKENEEQDLKKALSFISKINIVELQSCRISELRASCDSTPSSVRVSNKQIQGMRCDASVKGSQVRRGTRLCTRQSAQERNHQLRKKCKRLTSASYLDTLIR